MMEFDDWKCTCGTINYSWREKCRMCDAPKTTIGNDLFRAQGVKEGDEVIEITNTLARQGILIDTEKRTDDWISFVRGNRETWEAGETQLEAVQKIANTLTNR